MKSTEAGAGEQLDAISISEVKASLERVLSERQSALGKLEKIRKRRSDLLATLERTVGRGVDIFTHPDFKKAEALAADQAALDVRVQELAEAEEALLAKLAAARDLSLQEKIDAALKGKLDEHRLEIADLDVRMGRLLERRAQIVEESAAIYAATKGRVEIIDLDERAAHRYAAELASGAVPPPVLVISGPAETSRDRVLSFEQRAVDLAVQVLTNEKVIATASMAIAWSHAVDNVWREHVREVVLLRHLLVTQDRRSVWFIEQCPDVHFMELPLVAMLDRNDEIDLVTLTEAALAQRIVTLAEVEDAQSGRRA
jgi:hypothetical protein